MTYGNMVAILLYRVIGRIGMMALQVEIVDEGSDTGGRTWDRFCGVSAKIRCPHDPGIGIRARLCVYAFGVIRNVVYDMGGCHTSVLINPGEVNCVCGCVMDFMVFLVYFRDNNQDIITYYICDFPMLTHICWDTQLPAPRCPLGCPSNWVYVLAWQIPTPPSNQMYSKKLLQSLESFHG